MRFKYSSYVGVGVAAALVANLTLPIFEARAFENPLPAIRNWASGEAKGCSSQLKAELDNYVKDFIETSTKDAFCDTAQGALDAASNGDVALGPPAPDGVGGLGRFGKWLKKNAGTITAVAAAGLALTGVGAPIAGAVASLGKVVANAGAVGEAVVGAVCGKGVQKVLDEEARKLNISNSIRACVADTKERARREALAVTKKMLVDNLADETLRWVQGEGGDDARLVKNFGSLLEDVQLQAINKAMSALDEATISSETKTRLQLQFQSAKAGGSKPIASNLDKTVPNVSGFRNDFRQGGFAGYLASLLPQNNPQGQELLAQNQFLETVSAEREKAVLESTSNGFRNEKQCISYSLVQKISRAPLLKNVPADANGKPSRAIPAGINQNEVEWSCERDEITVPGKTIASLLETALGADFSLVPGLDDVESLLNKDTKEIGSFGSILKRLKGAGSQGVNSPNTLSGVAATEKVEGFDPTRSYIEQIQEMLDQAKADLAKLETLSTQGTTQAVAALQAADELLACQKQFLPPNGCQTTVDDTVVIAGIVEPVKELQNDAGVSEFADEREQIKTIETSLQDHQSGKRRLTEMELIALMDRMNAVHRNINTLYPMLVLFDAIPSAITFYQEQRSVCGVNGATYQCPVSLFKEAATTTATPQDAEAEEPAAQ